MGKNKMQLHHITLLTGDIDSTSHFYTQILGFRFIKNSVNQENPTRRHIYFGNYNGQPGTVTTFIEVPRLGTRYDEDSYIQGLDYYAPAKGSKFWQQHLTTNNITFSNQNDILSFTDPQGTPIRICFIAEEPAAASVIRNSTIPPQYQLLRLKNTNIYVTDLDAEEHFLTEMTGIETVNHVLNLDLGQSITLIPAEQLGTKRFGRGSIDHVALSAVDKNEIAAIRNRGNERNFHFEKEIDRKYFYSVYFRDPNRNRIEFATLAPGFTVDEDLDSLGEKLGLPDNLEPLREELIDFYANEGVTFKS